MLVFSRRMLLGTSLEDRLLSAVSVYVFNMTPIHLKSPCPVHPPAEDAPSCGDRLPLSTRNTANTLHM